MQKTKISQYYRMINVPEGASVETIKQATKELLKKFHPDLNQNHRRWAETQTKRILEAYQVLVRNPGSAPRVITKGSPYKGPIHIRVVEKRQSYMETIFADKTETTKLYIDVNVIERVVPASAIQWMRPQIAGNYLGMPLYVINGILSLELEPIDRSYKALFLKKTQTSAPQLVYLFKDGGKFVEVKDRDKNDFLIQGWGQVQLPTNGGDVYLASTELLTLEALF
jgi:hypothetical protein